MKCCLSFTAVVNEVCRPFPNYTHSGARSRGSIFSSSPSCRGFLATGATDRV